MIKQKLIYIKYYIQNCRIVIDRSREHAQFHLEPKPILLIIPYVYTASNLNPVMGNLIPSRKDLCLLGMRFKTH